MFQNWDPDLVTPPGFSQDPPKSKSQIIAWDRFWICLFFVWFWMYILVWANFGVACPLPYPSMICTHGLSPLMRGDLRRYFGTTRAMPVILSLFFYLGIFPPDIQQFPYGEHSMENLEIKIVKFFFWNVYSSHLTAQWLFRFFIFYMQIFLVTWFQSSPEFSKISGFSSSVSSGKTHLWKEIMYWIL